LEACDIQEHIAHAFIIRRVGRLLPLLIFASIVFVVSMNVVVLGKKIVVATGHTELLRNPDLLAYFIPGLREIVATLTFTHALGFFDHLVLNVPAWSISVEFYTYFLFAAICMVAVGDSRKTIFALLSIVGLAISIWASVSLHHCIEEGKCMALTYDFGYLRCVHSFFLGALAWYASRVAQLNIASVQFGGAAALGLLFAVVDDYPAAAFAFPAVFAVVILSLCNDLGPLANLLRTRIFQRLGQRSYSIYLMHESLVLGFENFVRHAHSRLAQTAVLLAYVGTLYVVSGWTYRYIETPFREWCNRLAAGMRTARVDKPAAL
jgi:peptidoglycan/LPS O-acetylase OafA/YrhL